MPTRGLLDMGLTEDDIARKMGFKQIWRIRERTDLLRLLPQYQRDLEDRIITPSQAFELSRLPRDKQPILYEKIRAGKAGSYNKLRALTNALLVPPFEQVTFGPGLTADQERVGNKYDQMIDRLVRFISGSYDRQDLKLLKMVTGSSVAVNLEKLDLIIGELNKIKRALIEAESVREAAEAV